jgi:hypothetical protein
MRLVHKTTDGLSEEAQRVMRAGFHARKTYAAVARDLREIGVEVNERTIARRGREWGEERRRRQAARDYVSDLVAAAVENPDASQVLGALATDALIADPDGFKAGDPIKVQRLNLQAEKLRIEARKQDLDERRVAVEERRQKLAEAREQRAVAVLEKPDAEMTPEQRVREIEAIYGIKQ